MREDLCLASPLRSNFTDKLRAKELGRFVSESFVVEKGFGLGRIMGEVKSEKGNNR